jgi:hypothetical protein
MNRERMSYQMSYDLVQQLKFVRKCTIDYVKNMNVNRLEVVPAGLNNNIKWNLGHVYIVFEKFAFQLTGEKVNIPDTFPELFNPGTSPEDWSIESPKKDELITLLNEQIVKVESLLSERIHFHSLWYSADFALHEWLTAQFVE